MTPILGSTLRGRVRLETDVVVVGSGPAGAMVARQLAPSLQVVVLEEGPWVPPEQLPPDPLEAMALTYRQLGASLARGPAPMPIVQGTAVGGTSVINGAISWRLPKDVHRRWLDEDPGIEAGIPWEGVLDALDAIEVELGIEPTPEAVTGPNDRLLARGAEILGLDHRPTRRNVRRCQGLGRCLTGCPVGQKSSMDLTYLDEAARRGARIHAETRVTRVLHRAGRATGVEARTAHGTMEVTARHAVVMAASAVHTPWLLLRSGLGAEAVGRGFACHPGVSALGRFAEPVHAWRGSTQGHEVVGLRHRGIKLESLGLSPALLAPRLPGVGPAWSRNLEAMAHFACWGAAVRAEARGTVSRGLFGPVVRYRHTEADLDRIRLAALTLGRVMLAAGAEEVSLGVHGWPTLIRDEVALRALADGPPPPASAYAMVATHLFGTCRMGTDPRQSVVGPDFQHHRCAGLFVADSSVFPTNTGVNPQTNILALARLCAAAVAAR